MDVLIEKKMIDIKSEPVELAVVEKPSRRRSNSTSQVELEPCEEFPILYGLLTAPKSFKPKNSEELQFLPLLRAQGKDMTMMGQEEGESKEEKGRVMVTSRVQLVQCRRKNSRSDSSSVTRRSRSRSSESAGEEEEEEDDMDEIEMEEADSQNLDFCSRSLSNSPQTVDSSSNMSSVVDENNSPIFLNYLSGHHQNSNIHRRSENSQNHHNHHGEEEEDELDGESSRVSSPGGGNTSDESNLDDNIPTSTTSGFRRKACRLEHAIGNIVKRRRVQKRPTSNNSDTSSSSSSNSVPISMAPSSPTVSTTCVDPPSQPQQRGRSEILERILRSNTTTTNTRSADSQSPCSVRQPLNEQSRRGNNDDNNNNESGSHHEPFAKLRDLLTMSEDQMVKRRRLEYGISENKVEQDHHHQAVPMRRREFSPPRNNILASLLQKGRAPYDPISSHSPLQRNSAPSSHHFLSTSSIHKSDNHSSNNINRSSGGNEERPYKCSLCDLRFKKLPLLNRHVKTHSHIKRYVCRFCSHAFKRSDNLLAHMRTSCKGIKEHDTKFAAGGNSNPPPPRAIPPTNNNNNSATPGQIIPQLLSAPLAGPLSPMVSRSQLEEALLNLNEKRYVNLPASSPLVSTTTGSPPPPKPHLRQVIQPGPDFQSKHSKLLEILSGSPVVANDNPRFRMNPPLQQEEEQDEPLPLSLKIERRDADSPPPTCSSSSLSPNQSQFLRSHLQQNLRRLYSNSNQNELPLLEEEQEEVYEDEEGREVIYEEEENDIEQPLDLGRHHHHRALPSRPPPVPPPQQHQPSARSRDHPEIVSILSRQPKNVMMLGPDLRKLVGIDAL